MFIALKRKTESDPWGHELVVNVNFISKIEVIYTTPGGDRYELETGRKTLDAVRHYTVYVGGDRFMIAEENSQAFRILEQIYKDAVKD